MDAHVLYVYIKDNFQALFLSIHHVDSRDWTQTSRLYSKHSYPCCTLFLVFHFAFFSCFNIIDSLYIWTPILPFFITQGSQFLVETCLYLSRGMCVLICSWAQEDQYCLGGRASQFFQKLNIVSSMGQEWQEQAAIEGGRIQSISLTIFFEYSNFEDYKYLFNLI